jgi:hypothetical protein
MHFSGSLVYCISSSVEPLKNNELKRIYCSEFSEMLPVWGAVISGVDWSGVDSISMTFSMVVQTWIGVFIYLWEIFKAVTCVGILVELCLML